MVRRVRRRRRRRGGRRFNFDASATSATSAGCSATSSTGGRRRGGPAAPRHRPPARRRPRGRAHHVFRGRGRRHHHRRSTSPATRPARRATAPAPSPAPRRAVCPTAAGAASSTRTRACSRFSRPCPPCAAAGRPSSTTRARRAAARASSAARARSRSGIPAGVEDGQRIRLKGRGGPGRNGGPSGDLYVRSAWPPTRCSVATGRTSPSGAHHVPRGGARHRIAVPTLDGDPVTLRIPPGTRPGKVFRVKGRGMTTARAQRRPHGHRRGRRPARS